MPFTQQVSVSSWSSQTTKAASWIAVWERIHSWSRRLRWGLEACARRHELAGAQVWLLWHCSQAAGKGQSQVELSEAIECSPAQVSTIVERLRQRGLLEGGRDPLDRRRQVWRATCNGRKLIERVLAEMTELVGDWSLESLNSVLEECRIELSLSEPAQAGGEQ